MSQFFPSDGEDDEPQGSVDPDAVESQDSGETQIDPRVENPDDESSGAAPQGNLVEDERPRARQTDLNVPNAGDTGRVVRSKQPDYTPDEDGYVGVDPIYRNASDNKRRPRPIDEPEEAEAESE